MAAMAQPRTETAGRVPHSFFRVLRAVLRIALYALLIVAVLVVGSLGIWGQGKVETGVGEMSRLEAARVYLHLMGQKPAWPCWSGYVIVPMTGSVTIPLSHVQSAVGGEESWVDVPSAIRRQVVSMLRDVFHTGQGVVCTFPAPEDWTPELIGP